MRGYKRSDLDNNVLVAHENLNAVGLNWRHSREPHAGGSVDDPF